MEVKIEYRNKDLEIINVEVYDLDEYCRLLSQRVLSLLYMIEEYKNDELEFNELKHNIFDLAGNIKRLPKNIKQNDVDGRS